MTAVVALVLVAFGAYNLLAPSQVSSAYPGFIIAFLGGVLLLMATGKITIKDLP